MRWWLRGACSWIGLERRRGGRAWTRIGGLGVKQGLGTELENLEFCLERVGDGEGEGEGEGEDEVVLVKKLVIWCCWIMIGYWPLLWPCDGAVEECVWWESVRNGKKKVKKSEFRL